MLVFSPLALALPLPITLDSLDISHLWKGAERLEQAALLPQRLLQLEKNVTHLDVQL